MAADDACRVAENPPAAIGNAEAEDAFLHVSQVDGGGAPTASKAPSISGDGQRVAFEGGWTQFDSESNSSTDVIVANLGSGAVANEHRGTDGKPGASGSGAPALSADGAWVAFLSASGNLIPGKPSGALYDIYVASTSGPAIERISLGSGDLKAQGGRSLNPDMSGDGRYVVFESTVPNWGASGGRGLVDIYLKDRGSRQLTLLSTDGQGSGNGDSARPRISSNGRYVVFASEASNLSANDTNGYGDVFLWDRSTGALVNVTQPATTRNPNQRATRPDVASGDDDGTVVVFESARAFVPADTNNAVDIYAYLTKTGAFQLVSSRANGRAVAIGSEEASVSGDGRFVSFTSYADDLVPDDKNGTRDIFVKDLKTGAIARVSKSGAVVNDQASMASQISDDGRWIAFESGATNLASSDGNRTLPDIFRAANPLAAAAEPADADTDTVYSDTTMTLPDGVTNLVLTGSAAINGTGNALDNTLTGNAAANTLDGQGGNDMLYGCGANDRLVGGDGNDLLDGGPGNDNMAGGLGDDIYVSVAAGDIIVEPVNQGTDTVQTAVTWTLGGTLENLELTGSNPINGTGNSAANTLIGNDAANRLSGATGDDVIDGRGGDDSVQGGAGSDQLRGGAGADTFVLDSDVGVDTIADFEKGTDRLGFLPVQLRIGNFNATLDAAVEVPGPGGFAPSAELVVLTTPIAGPMTEAAAATAIGSATGAYAVGDRRLFIVQSGEGVHVYRFAASVADGVIRAGDLALIATLAGVADLRLADCKL